MNISAEHAVHHFRQHSLPAVTLISGAEELLNLEALEAARDRALKDGYYERQRLNHEQIPTLINELNSPSLFAPKRLIELHIEGKELSKNNAEMIAHVAELLLEHSRLIIFAPQLSKPHRFAWYKKLFTQGNLTLTSVTLYPDAFAQNIIQRLNQAGVRLTELAYERLLENCRGNLFAAKQAIQRLSIHPAAKKIIDEIILGELLDDFSHFNVFALSDAILTADWLKAYRIAEKLEAQAPKETTLLTTLIQKDATLLLNLQTGDKKYYADCFKQYNIRKNQQWRYLNALKRHNNNVLRTTLRLAAKLDRIDKGDEYGNYWLTLTQYLLLRA